MLKFKLQQQHTTIKVLHPMASNNETKKDITSFSFITLCVEYVYEDTNEENLNSINSKNTSKKKIVSDKCQIIKCLKQCCNNKQKLSEPCLHVTFICGVAWTCASTSVWLHPSCSDSQQWRSTGISTEPCEVSCEEEEAGRAD